MLEAVKRGSLLMMAFVALLLVIAPHMARASAAPTPFDNVTCMKNQQNGLTRRAQERTASYAKVFSNATMPNLNFDCVNKLMEVSAAIGSMTDLYGIVWAAIANIIQSAINGLCGTVMSAIQAAVATVQNALCIPLPHFNLSLKFPSFSGGGACSGVRLLPNISVTTGPRDAQPGVWTLWNLH